MEIRHIYYKTEDAAYTISYVLTRKQVKYINLRIKSNGEVAVSAHRRVPAAYVDKFVESKAPFILEALERVEKRREETGDRPHNYETGEIFRLLGCDYTLVVEEAGLEEIFFRGDSLVLRTKWPDHYPHKKNMMENGCVSSPGRLFRKSSTGHTRSLFLTERRIRSGPSAL